MKRRRRLRDDLPVDQGEGPTRSIFLLPGSSPSIVLGQEPTRPGTRTLVVGYDGSPLAQAAVVEAGLRAGQTGCVFVVYAYDAPPGFLGWPYYGRKLSQARAAGQHALADLLQSGTSLPDVEYIPELIAGQPAEAIARVAAVRNADEIVVGASHARGLRKHASVPHELERTVPVPVITIR